MQGGLHAAIARSAPPPPRSALATSATQVPLVVSQWKPVVQAGLQPIPVSPGLLQPAAAIAARQRNSFEHRRRFIMANPSRLKPAGSVSPTPRGGKQPSRTLVKERSLHTARRPLRGVLHEEDEV